MWLWLFMIAVGVLLLAGAVFSQFFWWSMIGFCVLWAAGIVVETFWNWGEEQAPSRHLERETPTEAPAVASASKATSRTG